MEQLGLRHRADSLVRFLKLGNPKTTGFESRMTAANFPVAACEPAAAHAVPAAPTDFGSNTGFHQVPQSLSP